MTTKTENVRLAFERPQRYLSTRRYDIQIRSEIVKELTQEIHFRRILDIGCGDGSVSIPLLTTYRQLTLLDLSSSMLALARRNIPVELIHNTELLNNDFLSASLGPHSYDLVLCIGVLAHIDSPEDAIATIARVLRPGGSVILEFTDSHHIVGQASTVFRSLWDTTNYALNRLSRRQVLEICRVHGFAPSAVYRYSEPPPGSHRVFTQRTLYDLTRKFFGTVQHNRHATFGNEFIYRLRHDANTEILAKDGAGKLTRFEPA